MCAAPVCSVRVRVSLGVSNCAVGALVPLLQCVICVAGLIHSREFAPISLALWQTFTHFLYFFSRNVCNPHCMHSHCVAITLSRNPGNGNTLFCHKMIGVLAEVRARAKTFDFKRPQRLLVTFFLNYLFYNQYLFFVPSVLCTLICSCCLKEVTLHTFFSLVLSSGFVSIKYTYLFLALSICCSFCAQIYTSHELTHDHFNDTWGLDDDLTR